jgi:hypothetical protein
VSENFFGETLSSEIVAPTVMVRAALAAPLLL